VTPRVVAFDLSLTSTGVADCDGTRRICPKSTGVERLAEVRDAVIRACYRHILAPDLVVIEGYSYGSGNSAHQVGELGGVVRLALHEAGIRYEVVPPASLKLYACGVGNAGKDDVLLAAVRRLGYEGKSKDEADALWLYALAMHALGEPIVDVPKAHLRALKALPWAVAVAA
jgi:crossover junction endodeoxyribonuclease RuvC